MTQGNNRRLSAIMMMDVVGYSQMMAEDEAKTLAVWLQVRRAVIDPSVDRHGGRIVKLMGDGALVEFPSVTAAVQCGADIQKVLQAPGEVQPIRLRIGINLGEVIVEGDDIYGDGVNVAARIEPLAAPGGVAVSRTVFDQLGRRTGFSFADGGLHDVKNIPHPVQVYHLNTRGAEHGTVRVEKRKRRFSVPAVIGMACVIAVAAYWFLASDDVARDQPQTTASDTAKPKKPVPGVASSNKPSVAVLPFENLSGDPQQSYFSDGIAQNLLTDLSRVSGLIVIARNTSFAFRDQRSDLPAIARELQVRYVVDGSVQKAGETVRINASLIDAGSGRQLWAGKMDRKFDDLFALQDEVTSNIIDALHVELTTAERRQLAKRYTESLEAYDLYLRAWEEIWRFNEESRRIAQRLLIRALEVDPDFALAKAILATSYTNRTGVNLRNNLEALDRAYRLAKEAQAQDPDLPSVQSALGLIHMFRREYDLAEAAFDRAIELDPNYADAYAMQAWTWHYAGYPEKAMKGFEFALRLNPRAPFPYLNAMAEVQFSLGNYEESLRLNTEAINRNPEALRQRLFLAAVYAKLGQQENAEWEIQEALLLEPELTITSMEQIAPYKDPATLNNLIDALRIAGLPEPE